MGLREQAELDLAITMEDPVCGFGWPIVLTDPAGVSKPLTGLSTDIAQLIDPDTGETVSGRLASVALRISSIESADPGPALSLPEAVALNSSAPWLVAFDDINGKPYTFKVAKSNPDRALGVITLIVENWET